MNHYMIDRDQQFPSRKKYYINYESIVYGQKTSIWAILRLDDFWKMGILGKILEFIMNIDWHISHVPFVSVLVVRSVAEFGVVGTVLGTSSSSISDLGVSSSSISSAVFGISVVKTSNLEVELAK